MKEINRKKRSTNLGGGRVDVINQTFVLRLALPTAVPDTLNEQTNVFYSFKQRKIHREKKTGTN